jgi:hypothetical protein
MRNLFPILPAPIPELEGRGKQGDTPGVYGKPGQSSCPLGLSRHPGHAGQRLSPGNWRNSCRVTKRMLFLRESWGWCVCGGVVLLVRKQD